MTARYRQILFTPEARQMQAAMYTAKLYEADAGGAEAPDRLGERETAFVTARDSFYMASLSQSGWPYLQHRGGPKGFLKVLNPETLAFADFRGNGQYLSTGNFKTDGRVSLFLMDYADRARLKILGHAEFFPVEAEPDLARRVALEGYRAIVEHIVRIRLTAFDWNCPQHITKRFTAEDMHAGLSDILARMKGLETRNAALEAELAALKSSS